MIMRTMNQTPAQTASQSPKLYHPPNEQKEPPDFKVLGFVSDVQISTSMQYYRGGISHILANQ